jgi:inhibitor of cysteine peptidase
MYYDMTGRVSPLRILAVLALLVLALAACGGDSGGADGGGDSIEVAEADSGGSREVAVGEEIDVVLPSNPTTGYSWNALGETDAAVVALVDRDYEPSSDAVGAGGMETLTYRAEGPGETTIDLGYFQPWEPSNVDETFSITVVVSDS